MFRYRNRQGKICAAFLEQAVRDRPQWCVEPFSRVPPLVQAGATTLPKQSTIMKSIRVLLLASLAPLALSSAVYAADHGHGSHGAQPAELTKAQTKFLANYEGVRSALTADDLDAAKRSAGNITESQNAAQLSKAASLNAARVAFKKLSTEAIQIAKGHEGYYVVNCPMAGSDWLQTNTTIGNPYLGRQMSTCGSIKN